MRYLLTAALLAAVAVPAHAQALRTGAAANEYLSAFYAREDLVRECTPDRIEVIKNQRGEQFYADLCGALFHKRRLSVNQLQRRAGVRKQDRNLHAAIDQAEVMMKHLGAYQAKLRE